MRKSSEGVQLEVVTSRILDHIPVNTYRFRPTECGIELWAGYWTGYPAYENPFHLFHVLPSALQHLAQALREPGFRATTQRFLPGPRPKPDPSLDALVEDLDRRVFVVRQVNFVRFGVGSLGGEAQLSFISPLDALGGKAVKVEAVALVMPASILAHMIDDLLPLIDAFVATIPELHPYLLVHDESAEA